ncbi:MAG: 2-isopropylmalate synthase [Clostridia bacterium]|jgi:2-isopropylmalate synthase|nr:2-isopropylmalate synthase [Clostridia bacterium]
MKYRKQFILPQERCMDWAEKDMVERAPIWCSVDLRDGNQALVKPMDKAAKLDFFKLLVKIGFKEIEVGFPAASDTEYEFVRTLIEEHLIPDDVTVQVLTQAREHIIKKTFEAIKGAKNVIVHVYNSTSVAQREQVFRKSKEEIKRIAVDGAKLLERLTKEAGANYRFEYSPESFTGTEPEYALEVVNAVLDVWQPAKDRKAIVNLPATVENAMPHVYAQQVEYIHKHLKYRENVVLSIHPHNDRGTGIGTAEFGLLAGADRVEGTLFGNGERTGNCDVVALAMNMLSQGIDPHLHFSDLPRTAALYTRYTGMSISPRQPYAGELVFAAFSGSHQDAIAKGMRYREENRSEEWSVPYLPIDPSDVGRVYDSDVIRINSQSGKGGVGYVLEQAYGIKLPAKMKEDVSYRVKRVSDEGRRELKASEIFELFVSGYLDSRDIFDVTEAHYRQEDGITAVVSLIESGSAHSVTATGNGRLDAVSNALKAHFGINYLLTEYEQHALSTGSFAQAISYVAIEKDGKTYWGAGENSDIIRASVCALVSAVNNLLSETERNH